MDTLVIQLPYGEVRIQLTKEQAKQIAQQIDHPLEELRCWLECEHADMTSKRTQEMMRAFFAITDVCKIRTEIVHTVDDLVAITGMSSGAIQKALRLFEFMNDVKHYEGDQD